MNKQTKTLDEVEADAELAGLLKFEQSQKAKVAAAEQKLEAVKREADNERQKLEEVRAHAQQQLAAARKKIAARRIAEKVRSFVETACILDDRFNGVAMAQFEKLASELSFLGRLKQPSYQARSLALRRMCGEETAKMYRRPFESYEQLAHAWLKPAEGKAA